MLILNQIVNNKTTPEILDRINKIKSIAWPYDFEEHKKWIKNNLKPSDVHFILTQNNTDIAYLNLIDTSARINNQDIRLWGIGNVCAMEKGKGYGSHIMKLTNKYLENNSRIGLLFCKKDLISFYSNLDWLEIDKALVKITTTNQNVTTMVFNCQIKINSIEYDLKLF